MTFFIACCWAISSPACCSTRIRTSEHVGEIGGAVLVLHLDERTALEVDAVIQANDEVEAERHRHTDDGDDEAKALIAHEGHPHVVREEVKAFEVWSGEEHGLPL